MPGGIARIFKPGHGLIDYGRVCCLKPIIAKLIRGAQTEKAISVMKDLVDALPLLAGWHLIIPVGEGGQECWYE